MTIFQTLADYTEVISFIHEAGLQLQSDRIILFGHDFGGTYAVWLKYMIPSIATGIIAYSAPLAVRTEFPEFFEDIIDTVISETGGYTCSEIIGGAFEELDELVLAGSADEIRELLNLHYPINLADSQEVGTLFYALASLLGTRITISK